MSDKANHSAAIAEERAKSNLIYREAVAPGLDIVMDLKAILCSAETEFQKVDILETYFGKTLVTDGKTQSSQFDESAYHESLVHPALLKAAASGNPPKSVFIGGGGELATAREVLRHSSVERCVMVDLDGKVVDFCTEHLPEWGGLAVRNDPRFELVVGDAYAYLFNSKETFDVIIMDISDPIEAGPGIMLYTQEFYQYAMERLSPHGVFITQAGTADSIPPAVVEYVKNPDPSCFAPILNTLSTSFECVCPYTTNIPSFGGDWGFIMAFRANGGDKKQLTEDWKIPPKGLIDELLQQQIPGGAEMMKFYDSETHLTMFALTKPLRRYLAQDQRIMTKENPIFMF